MGRRGLGGILVELRRCWPSSWCRLRRHGTTRRPPIHSATSLFAHPMPCQVPTIRYPTIKHRTTIIVRFVKSPLPVPCYSTQDPLAFRHLIPMRLPSPGRLRSMGRRSSALIDANRHVDHLPSSDELSQIQRTRRRRLPLSALAQMRTLRCTAISTRASARFRLHIS